MASFSSAGPGVSLRHSEDTGRYVTDTQDSFRPLAIALDVYGTLVDPLEMDEHLRAFAGDDAPAMSALWRQKQLEYSFRRGLMREYRDFGVCTEHALLYAAESFGVELTSGEIEELISAYQDLRAFPDVVPALRELRSRGYPLFAFSNGREETARTLLTNGGVAGHLDGIVSVDDVETFKPAPEVYAHLASKLDVPPEGILLVSSNPFDIIGAINCGLEAAWVRRDPTVPFDPWGYRPRTVVGDLGELAGTLPRDHP